MKKQDLECGSHNQFQCFLSVVALTSWQGI